MCINLYPYIQNNDSGVNIFFYKPSEVYMNFPDFRIFFMNDICIYANPDLPQLKAVICKHKGLIRAAQAFMHR